MFSPTQRMNTNLVRCSFLIGWSVSQLLHPQLWGHSEVQENVPYWSSKISKQNLVVFKILCKGISTSGSALKNVGDILLKAKECPSGSFILGFSDWKEGRTRYQLIPGSPEEILWAMCFGSLFSASWWGCWAIKRSEYSSESLSPSPQPGSVVGFGTFLMELGLIGTGDSSPESWSADMGGSSLKCFGCFNADF